MLPRVLLALPFLLAATVAGGASTGAPRPNVVLIFCDDLGYGDPSCYGNRQARTPNIDRLAREGIRFTDFYCAQPVCSASRAALLTGCYPNRIGIAGALDHRARTGLNPDEITLPELLKRRGYATGIVGKWHLGHVSPFLPMQHGFDSWFGLPYSNDMWPFHPEAKPGSYPPLPLFRNASVLDPDVLPAEQERLTTRYTEEAAAFIRDHHRQPFFLYLAHSMPHVPLFVSPERRHRSRDLYAQVLEEIDDSVGAVLRELRRHDIDRNTLVIFTSDNGPWLSYGDHAGSSGGLREGKGTCWEGGVRVPFVARWPGRLPRGAVCEEPAMTIDILPTVAGLAGAGLPDHRIDGLDILPLLENRPGAKSPHQALWFYYHVNELQAVRSGDWKLVLPHAYRTLEGEVQATGGIPARYHQAKAGLELYNLRRDPAESRNRAADHPEIVKQLMEHVERARADLGDSLTGRAPSNARPPGKAL